MASASHKKSHRGGASPNRASKTRPARRSAPRPKRKGAVRRPTHPPKKVAKKAARPKPKKPAARPTPPRGGSHATEAVTAPPPRSGDGRRHVLSLSFLRDGDEFLARIETDAGQITEFKHRVLDQLLSLVASELEDLLE